jgi:hypothetical protein
MSREKRVSGIRRLLTIRESPHRVQHDVHDEIRFHLESRVAELVAYSARTRSVAIGRTSVCNKTAGCAIEG